MKLHLPKGLLTAVLAAVIYSSVSWGATAYHAGKDAYLLGGSNDGIGGINTSTLTEGFSVSQDGITTVPVINSTGMGDFKIWADKGDTAKAAVQINEWKIDDGAELNVGQNDWNADRYLELHIDKLDINAGSATLKITLNKHQVAIDSVNGTLHITNAGQLTIGVDANADASDESDANFLGSTIVNTGTLTLAGSFKVENLDQFSSTATGSLTNVTHGFRVGQVTYNFASGGTINTTDGFCVTLGETDITDELNITSSAITYTVEGTSTVYEITSGYTTKVVYNGSTGDTAAATGFIMENGTTLELAASTTSLKDGIAISAGNGGSVTLAFTSGTHDFDALVDTQSGICNLNISGEGTVVSTNHSDANGFVTGNISITDGGKLVLQNKDALGWGTVPPTILIEDATLELGGRQTTKTDLQLKGNAVITTAKTTLSEGDAPILHSFGTKWTVSGTGNVIESGVKIRLDKNLTIDVAEAGELSIKGNTEDGNDHGTLTKDGAGKLIFDGATKSIVNQIQMLAGTLQLGGKTETDGVVTLEKGINHTGGTVDVVGQAVIKGTSTLGGAITVASTGELTLNSTYTLTGSLTVAGGGKVMGGNDLIRSTTAPAGGANGWGTTTVTILKSAADATVRDLNSVWYKDKEYTVSTSVAEGITSYQFNEDPCYYYVQNTAEAVEYSTASGLTQAEAIYMSNGTKLNVRENLNFSGLTIADGAKVKFDVQGATLNINVDNNVNNIAELTIGQGGEVRVANWNTSLGNSNERVSVLLTDGGKFTFSNGNSTSGGGAMHVNMTVDGSGVLGGSNFGPNSTVHGTIAGNGSLKLTNAHNDNVYTVAAVISDGVGEGDKLAVEVDSTTNNITLSGANTYSGGTTVNAGKLTAANESALGTGKVTMNGGTLAQSAALSVSSMEYNGGTVNNNGNNLTVRDTLTVKSNMEITGAGATTIGTLDLTAGTTLTTSGALTLGSITLDLSGYTAGYSNTLVSATNGGSISWNEKSWTSTGLGTGLVANVGFADESQTTLQLTISAAEEEITSVKTSVTGVVGYDAATDMLTLEVKDKVTSGTMVSLTLITDKVLADIQAALNGADDMFRITVQYDDTHKVVAESFDQVVFYNEKGQGYWGEMVDLGGNVGTKLAYKLDRIPEPASATLSLAALMMLCARRRRRA